MARDDMEWKVVFIGMIGTIGELVFGFYERKLPTYLGMMVKNTSAQ